MVDQLLKTAKPPAKKGISVQITAGDKSPVTVAGRDVHTENIHINLFFTEAIKLSDEQIGSLHCHKSRSERKAGLESQASDKEKALSRPHRPRPNNSGFHPEILKKAMMAMIKQEQLNEAVRKKFWAQVEKKEKEAKHPK